MIAWASPEEAATFVSAYRELLAFHNGQPVADRDAVYNFTLNPTYEMAVGIERNADRVRIVTAPTVDELQAVDRRFQVSNQNSTNVSAQISDLQAEIDRLEAQLSLRDRRIGQLPGP